MKNIAKYFLLSILPLGLLISLMALYASEIPYADEWAIAHLLEKFHEGTLTFWDIFAQHNEHRIITGKIIMLLNAIFFGWNIYLELAVNVLFAVGSSIIIYYAVNKLELDNAKKYILYFTCACIIFSFSQQHCYMWGFQMQTFHSVFFNLLAIVILAYDGNIFIAIISAVLAEYSFANGMMAWPAGLCVLILREKKLFSRKNILWLVCSVIFIASYFYGYTSSMTAEKITLTERILSALKRPHLFIILFATYLGAPLAGYRQSLALVFGFTGIFIHAFCFWKIYREKISDKNFSFWLGSDVYMLLSAAVTAYGRQGTVSTAMALRYMAINMLFWVITPCLFFMTLEKNNSPVPKKYYILFAVLILSHSLTEDALIRARERFDNLNAFKNYIDAGIYESNYVVGKREAYLIPKLKSYGVKFLVNAPDVIEFDDFKKINELEQGKEIFCEIESLEVQKDFISVLGFWKADDMREKDLNHANTFLILQNDSGVFEAVLERQQEIPKLTIIRDKNLQEKREKYFFIGDLYCGNLPAGEYDAAIKVRAFDGEIYFSAISEKVITLP